MTSCWSNKCLKCKSQEQQLLWEDVSIEGETSKVCSNQANDWCNNLEMLILEKGVRVYYLFDDMDLGVYSFWFGKDLRASYLLERKIVWRTISLSSKSVCVLFKHTNTQKRLPFTRDHWYSSTIRTMESVLTAILCNIITHRIANQHVYEFGKLRRFQFLLFQLNY